jgi:hypothetical protein
MLNVTADKLVQEQWQTMTQACELVTTNHAYLTINNITITKDCQKWVMETLSSIPIHQYFDNKYRWKPATFHKNQLDRAT